MGLLKSKVSVLMPVYNGMPLIKASIASLKQQTYINWECIIVDDGSTDGTSEYIDSLNDSRFVVHHFEHNCGRPVARQKCLDMATGELIALLDAGDLYHPDKLSIQVDAITKNGDVALVGSRMCSFGTKTDKLYVRGVATRTPVLFQGGDVPCHATCLLRGNRAKKISYDPSLQLGEDVDFLEKYLKSSRYIVLNDVLYYYSELDSVTKPKICRSYFLYAKKFIKSGDWKRGLLFSMKFIYSKIVFPFVSIDCILSRRGQVEDSITREEYNQHCKSIIDKAL